MTFEEFAVWLHQEVREGRMQQSQLTDLLTQRSLFDRNRKVLEAEFLFKVVGYVAETRQIADSVSALLRLAATLHPGQMLYFEPIGYRVF